MSCERGCLDTLKKLETFLDRELTGEEVTVVHFHLEACPPCKHVFRFEEHLRQLVRVRCCTDAAPASLRAQILARMRAKA